MIQSAPFQRRGPELEDEAIPKVVRDTMANPLGLSAAGANVIMQLSWLPVGRGVVESTVESGRADKHPIKRLRTTLSFLAVAMLGSRDDRLAIRREINKAHAMVRSAAGDAVAYDAFDPALQLWVAACLYRGVEQIYELIYGRPDEATADILYRHSARLGTTLQVTPDMWPPDRTAFDAYWDRSIENVKMDDTTRTYLRSLASLEFLPRPVPSLLGPLHRFVAVGFLPERMRDELGLPWNLRRQRIFELATRTGGRLSRLVPYPLRALPFNLCLWDVRRRIRRGLPIV